MKHVKRISLLLLLLLGGCINTPEDISYQHMLDLIIAEGIPGAVLLVKTPDFTFIGVSGYADREAKILMDENQLFRIASTSKLFIGVLCTMLHCENVLSLDDSITTWLPPSITDHIPYADVITICQLLNHTSGVYDYGESTGFQDAVRATPDRKWSAEDVLLYVYGKPPYFEPGTNWQYSNTNYVLAGLILDEALEYHHSQAIRERILDPLHMDSTFYEHHDTIKGEIVHGYSDIDRDGILDDILIDQGYGLADCGLLSTVGDLSLFMEALFETDFPDPEYRNEFMRELLPQGDDFYGMGIMKYPSKYSTGYGNGGHFTGYESNVIYFPDDDITIIYFVNGTGPRLNKVMDDFLDRILEKVFSELNRAIYS